MADTIPELPQWLADIIRVNLQPNGNGIDNYARNFAKLAATSNLRGQAYAASALDGAVAELSATPTGKRNETLNAVAFRLGRMVERGWVDEKTVAEALLDACAANRYLGARSSRHDENHRERDWGWQERSTSGSTRPRPAIGL